MLGIIERTGQISMDNALQYVSDVKEDIDLYEEVSDEEEPQDVQDFYKRNRTVLNNELEEIQEKIQAALEQTEVYENQREKVQKQAEFCKSKAEQKKEQFSDDLYNGLMQDIDSFIRNDDRNGQCDIEAVKNALYADKEGIETVREQMHGLPITNVHETFFTLIVGLISLIRSHPNISDRTIKEVMAQTLHIESYVV